jgi:hypothetical protein
MTDVIIRIYSKKSSCALRDLSVRIYKSTLSAALYLSPKLLNDLRILQIGFRERP